MGWNSGNHIFDPMCEKLQTSHLWDGTRKEILITLIKTLQGRDWDTEDESLKKFQDDPIVVAAFGERGVHLWGTREYDEAYGEDSFAEKNKDLLEGE